LNNSETGDPNKPIEEYPGILGYFLDGDLFVIHEALNPLTEIDFHDYTSLLEEQSTTDDHVLTVNLSSGDKILNVYWHDYGMDVLSQIPSVVICQDEEPEGIGPGYSPGYNIFMSDHFSIEQISHDIAALSEAIKADHARLQSTH
jgi:hypothetical protein